MWVGHILYMLPVHHGSRIKHQHTVLCFTTSQHCGTFVVLLISGLNKATKDQIWTCLTRKVPYSHCLCRVLRSVLSGRFFFLTEHFRKHGARAVAMAAPEELVLVALVAPWRTTSASSQFTHACNIPTASCLSPPTPEDHSHTTKIVSEMLFKILRHHSQHRHTTDLPSTPTPSLFLFLCPLHPHRAAYAAPLSSSVLYKLWSSDSKNKRQRPKPTPSLRSGANRQRTPVCADAFLYTALNIHLLYKTYASITNM